MAVDALRDRYSSLDRGWRASLLAGVIVVGEHLVVAI